MKKINSVVNVDYNGDSIAFLRDAVAFFNDRRESANENKSVKQLLEDFADTCESEATADEWDEELTREN